MAHKRSGQLAKATECWKHMRAYAKKAFWSRERRAERKLINKVRDECRD